MTVEVGDYCPSTCGDSPIDACYYDKECGVTLTNDDGCNMGGAGARCRRCVPPTCSRTCEAAFDLCLDQPGALGMPPGPRPDACVRALELGRFSLGPATCDAGCLPTQRMISRAPALAPPSGALAQGSWGW